MLSALSPIAGLGGGGGLSSSSSATSSASSGSIYEGTRSTSFDPTFGAGGRGPSFNFAFGDSARVSASSDINPPDSTPKWLVFGAAAVAAVVGLFFILKKA